MNESSRQNSNDSIPVFRGQETADAEYAAGRVPFSDLEVKVARLLNIPTSPGSVTAALRAVRLSLLAQGLLKEYPLLNGHAVKRFISYPAGYGVLLRHMIRGLERRKYLPTQAKAQVKRIRAFLLELGVSSTPDLLEDKEPYPAGSGEESLRWRWCASCKRVGFSLDENVCSHCESLGLPSEVVKIDREKVLAARGLVGWMEYAPPSRRGFDIPLPAAPRKSQEQNLFSELANRLGVSISVVRQAATAVEISKESHSLETRDAAHVLLMLEQLRRRKSLNTRHPNLAQRINALAQECEKGGRHAYDTKAASA